MILIVRTSDPDFQIEQTICPVDFHVHLYYSISIYVTTYVRRQTSGTYPPRDKKQCYLSPKYFLEGKWNGFR
jgi:hypothetical protein